MVIIEYYIAVLFSILLVVIVLKLLDKKTEKILYIDKPIDKIVYVDKPIEKIIYKDKIVYVDKPIEKIVYIDAPTKTKTKVSNQKTNLLKELQDLKNKKKKTKKDIENIYTLEMVIPNIK